MIASSPTSIFWFRQDLRLQDNPGLAQAIENGHCLPIYILDNINPKTSQMGAASQAWLHHSLSNLDQTLNHQLNFYSGAPEEILKVLVKKHNINAIYWNRCYESWRILRDKKIKQTRIPRHS